MIQVLIVEDDPMVANLNKTYIEQVEGFHVAAVAADVEEAFLCMEKNKVNLILLDVYMPGRNGIEYLKELRKADVQADVILITAASEKEHIQQSLRLGAIDYLIKPFEFNRLKAALERYKENQGIFQKNKKVGQSELDHLFIRKAPEPRQHRTQIPKGMTETTLNHIIEIIQTQERENFSTEQIADLANISRVSVRKYLKFLKEIEFLEENLIYGVGRPVYQYRLKNKQNVNMKFYQ